MKRPILSFFLLLSFAAQAQLIRLPGDSLKADTDTVQVPAVQSFGFYNYNFAYKARLDSIQNSVPLSYNEYVHQFIDIYSRRKEMIGRMLGLSKYYFPIFEKALQAYRIPSEIKYLPIIESAMNPHAVSRVGATGLWQFMFGTAKGYGLNMDNFVDERKDPIQASYAAAAYFRDAYDELGDWLLAIAAYNCGKGNVTRAIEKAGSRDFWQIRSFLPRETRDYVPAFIAALYVMNYAGKHQIETQRAEMPVRTDTIHVHHYVALADVSKALGVNEDLLFSLNPSYKKKVVNGTLLSPKRIIMPAVDYHQYEALYEVLNTDIETDREIILASTDDVRELRKKMPAIKVNPVKVQYHTVAKGQNLSIIAEKYGVEVQDLKVWNKLKSLTIVPGQKLKVQRAPAEKPASKTRTAYSPGKTKAKSIL